MRFLKPAILIAIFTISISVNPVCSQELILPDNFPDYEFAVSNSPDDGYLFITSRPQSSGKMPAWMQIVDNYGTPVFYRFLPYQTGSISVHDNGLIAYNYTSGSTTKIYIMDSSYVVVDSLGMDDYKLDTHDYIAMENGHFLIFGKDLRIVDMSQYVEGGDPNATVTGFVIQELDENKNVVFEWNCWDYFEVTDTYKDLTASSIELAHPNSIDLDYDGNILLISRSMNEITKIDRQTRDIIWRLGGKNNQFDFADTSHMFSLPHSLQLTDNGNYTLFDNGSERDPAYSRAIEYAIDQENKTIEMVWEYDAEKQIYGRSGGSTQRLPSGNTIICYGGNMNDPSMIEVHSDGSKAWQLNYLDANSSGGAKKFPWKTNLFEFHSYDLDFGEYEYDPMPIYLVVTNNADYDITLTGYSTRTDAFTIQESFPIIVPTESQVNLEIVFEPLSTNTGYFTDVMTINSDINSDTLVQRISQQVKLMGTQEDLTGPNGIISISWLNHTPQDTLFYITFNEAIRLLDDDVLTYENIDHLLTLKYDDESGSDIPFDAVIDTDKRIITIIPAVPLDPIQTFYVAINNGYEDYTGNQGTGISATFNTIDFTPPIGTVNPQNGSVNIDPDSDLIIQFNESIRNLNNSEILDINLDTIVILKLGDESGADVPFNATINFEKTMITVSPAASLSENTNYYVAIWRGVEDSHNNLADTVYSQFTTGLASRIKFPDEFSLRVYPNPGDGIYQIRFPDKQDRMIRVTDMVGKTILREVDVMNDEFLLDLSDRPNNIYLLFIEEPGTGKTMIRKLIKQ